MSQAALANENDTLIFWVFPGLRYRLRMLLAFGLMLAGLALQGYYGQAGWAAGVLVILLGNLLLLVKGYDNRVDLAAWQPDEEWQTVDRPRLQQVLELDRRMKRWDRSWMDVTNIRGIITLGVLVALLVGGWGLLQDSPYRILLADAGVLLLPHWFTGTRRLLRLPDLVVKAETLEHALESVATQEDPPAEVLMLLQGDRHPVPRDIKIRLMPKEAPEDFLGLYGQVVINAVQGKSWPYFYVVLVARPALGLEKLADGLDVPAGLLAEFRRQEGVEVLVLRQQTTRRKGYHTGPERVTELLRLGQALMRRLAGGR